MGDEEGAAAAEQDDREHVGDLLRVAGALIVGGTPFDAALKQAGEALRRCGWVQLDDLVGQGEIAGMFEGQTLGEPVQRGTVDMWVQRKLLPEPVAVVSRTPLYSREEIRGWAKKTGRKLLGEGGRTSNPAA